MAKVSFFPFFLGTVFHAKFLNASPDVKKQPFPAFLLNLHFLYRPMSWLLLLQVPMH